jgi:hypothetical protein
MQYSNNTTIFRLRQNAGPHFGRPGNFKDKKELKVKFFIYKPTVGFYNWFITNKGRTEEAR